MLGSHSLGATPLGIHSYTELAMYTLTADADSFDIGGNSVYLLAGRRINSEAGSFTVFGGNVIFSGWFTTIPDELIWNDTLPVQAIWAVSSPGETVWVTSLTKDEIWTPKTDITAIWQEVE